MEISKVIYGGRTLIDLTNDTVAADYLMEGITAHNAAGVIVSGALLDGDSLGYGDPTQPIVGVGQIDAAVLQE